MRKQRPWPANTLGNKRYQHTLNVEEMAVRLADRYGADPHKAALAALLHDTAKEMPTARQLELLRQYPDLAGDTENRPTPVWHGVCAAILAQTQWGVTDPEILSAVACHTTGKPGMSLLDKILYLADMTCAERDFEGVEQLAPAGVRGHRPGHAGRPGAVGGLCPARGAAFGPHVRRHPRGHPEDGGPKGRKGEGLIKRIADSARECYTTKRLCRPLGRQRHTACAYRPLKETGL